MHSESNEYNVYAHLCALLMICKPLHHTQEFTGYFTGSMPWTAIPFEEERHRSRLSEVFQVNGIPRLVILSGKSGKVVESETRSFDFQAWVEKANKIDAKQ